MHLDIWPAVGGSPPVTVPLVVLLKAVRDDGWPWDDLLPSHLLEHLRAVPEPDIQQVERLGGHLHAEHLDGVRNGTALHVGAVSPPSPTQFLHVATQCGLALVILQRTVEESAELVHINSESASGTTALRTLVRGFVPERDTPYGQRRVVGLDGAMEVARSNRQTLRVRFADPAACGFEAVPGVSGLVWTGLSVSSHWAGGSSGTICAGRSPCVRATSVGSAKRPQTVAPGRQRAHSHRNNILIYIIIMSNWQHAS